MEKYGPKVGMAFMNTMLDGISFRLIRKPNGKISRVCLVDMQTWECLTVFIAVEDWRKITKAEWKLICNGCPECFYNMQEGDISFSTVISDLTFQETVDLIEVMAAQIRILAPRGSLSDSGIEQLLEGANIPKTDELIEFLKG